MGITINREQLAWAAGLFEGEGSFFEDHTNDGCYPRAVIQMTDEDVLRRFQKLMAFGYVYLRRAPKNRPNTKDSWAWVANSYEHFQQTVCYLWPHLGLRRRAKIKAIMTNYHRVTAERAINGPKRRSRVK